MPWYTVLSGAVQCASPIPSEALTGRRGAQPQPCVSSHESAACFTLCPGVAEMTEALRETATDRNANNWTSSRKEPEVGCQHPDLVVCQLRSLVTGRHPSDFRTRMDLFAFQELYTPVNHPLEEVIRPHY